VRDQVTYRITYGDKETWWFGLELAEGGYAFEQYYGGVAGWVGEREGPADPGADVVNPKVCSYVIAHADEDDGLLWYNGSLLKNKVKAAGEYLVPTHWMVNGTWDKGNKGQYSCMGG